MPYKIKVKTSIIFEGINGNSNPFRVFTRMLWPIYRQNFIEIGRGHLGRFPRQRLEKCWFSLEAD